MKSEKFKSISKNSCQRVIGDNILQTIIVHGGKEFYPFEYISIDIACYIQSPEFYEKVYSKPPPKSFSNVQFNLRRCMGYFEPYPIPFSEWSHDVFIRIVDEFREFALPILDQIDTVERCIEYSEKPFFSNRGKELRMWENAVFLGQVSKDSQPDFDIGFYRLRKWVMANDFSAFFDKPVGVSC